MILTEVDVRWGCPLLAALLLACGRISAPLVGGPGNGVGTSGAGSGGSGTAGTTGTTSSSNSSTGNPLPPVCLWRGDICAVADCAHTSDYQPCALSDGGLGTCVDGQCNSVDYLSDAKNCGGNGIVCPPETRCVDGNCGSYYYSSFCGGCFEPGLDCADGGGCPIGTTCASNGCIVTDCTLAPADAVCWVLSDAGPFNFNAGFCCNGSCQFSDSSQHCGGCSVECSPGSFCPYGRCTTPASCDSSTNRDVCALSEDTAGTCCNGTCTDLSTDPLNCGGCGIACPLGSFCAVNLEYALCSGPCFSDSDCPSGYGCNNSARYCPPGIDCNFPLPDAGGTCTLSECSPTTDGQFCLSDAGDFCCGGECIDITSNPAHCGSCATACGSGQFCWQSYCVLPDCSNASPFAHCALQDGGVGTCCGGTCVDTTLDPKHCDSCDWACPRDATACSVSSGANASCVDDAGTRVPGCQSDQDCAVGTSCAIDYGFCVPQSCDGGEFSCAYPIDGGAILGNCCGGQCDPDLEDGCAVPHYCSADSYDGQFCNLGPHPIDLGYCCGGQCTNPLFDPRNCGDCGKSCDGECQNGTCLDPTVPPCLQTCGPETLCAKGLCVDSTCNNPNSGFCLAEDGALGSCCGWACADLSTDPGYCGSCDIACPAGQACQNGFCNGITSCGPGQVNSYCNLDAGLSFLSCPGLGCIDTSSDPANCGLCANTCGAGQVCLAGKCH